MADLDLLFLRHIALSAAPVCDIVGGAFPTSTILYSDATRTQKVVEKTIERSISPATKLCPTPIVTKIYDATGALLRTITDTITYSGVWPVSATRAVT